MTTRPCRLLAAGLLAAVGAVGPAAAQTYQLAWYAGDQPVPAGGLSVPAGTDLVLDLYLRQTGTGPAPTLVSAGLSAFAARVRFDTPGVLSVPTPNPSAALAYPAGFSPYDTADGTSDANGLRVAGYTLTRVPATDSAVRLVSVRFATAEGTAELTAADIAQTADWFLGDDTQIDGLVGASQAVRVTVSPVPEPCLLIAAGGVGLLAAGRRHARRAVDGVRTRPLISGHIKTVG